MYIYFITTENIYCYLCVLHNFNFIYQKIYMYIHFLTAEKYTFRHVYIAQFKFLTTEK